jgi:MarR family transcriptional regulator, organic hydroperoxide resistance regulator
MRNTTAATSVSLPDPATAASSDPLVDAIVDELHQMIGSLRCAGTGRMVKAGISMTHLHILWVLEHHGALSMSRLADLLDVSLSNATGLVDRMEERGLVERTRVPDDRRIVVVSASAEGARQRDEIEALKQDGMRSILGRLTPAQLTRIHGAIVDLRAAAIDEIGTDHLRTHPHTA